MVVVFFVVVYVVVVVSLGRKTPPNGNPLSMSTLMGTIIIAGEITMVFVGSKVVRGRLCSRAAAAAAAVVAAMAGGGRRREEEEEDEEEEEE